MAMIRVVYYLDANDAPSLEEVVERFEDYRDAFKDAEQLSYCWLQVVEDNRVSYEAQPLDFCRFLQALVVSLPTLQQGTPIWVGGLEGAFAFSQDSTMVTVSFCDDLSKEQLRDFICSEVIENYSYVLRSTEAASVLGFSCHYQLSVPAQDWKRIVLEWGRLFLLLVQKRNAAFCDSYPPGEGEGGRGVASALAEVVAVLDVRAGGTTV